MKDAGNYLQAAFLGSNDIFISFSADFWKSPLEDSAEWIIHQLLELQDLQWPAGTGRRKLTFTESLPQAKYHF